MQSWINGAATILQSRTENLVIKRIEQRDSWWSRLSKRMVDQLNERDTR